MQFFKGKRVLVTGGAGFLGSHIVDLLRQEEVCEQVIVPRKRDYDFVRLEDAERCLSEYSPQILIHCAAYYGGIWINQLYPGRIYYEKLVMGANVMEAARKVGVEKFVSIGTACSYPGYLENYLSEKNLWDGIPHETVVNYGLTKKMMAIQGWAYKKQYGLNSVHLILTNLYGPRDTFNQTRAHVVSALLRKFVEAKQAVHNTVEIWGTGRPVREFLFVMDCAKAILLASERCNDTLPMNIGTGVGTSVRELAQLIQRLVGFQGELVWNREKPDGQLKKVLDVTLMRETLRWIPPTTLEEGLRKTIDWYVQNKPEADARE